MATLEFGPPTTSGPDTSSNAIALRASAAITDSYVATTNDANCLGWDYVVFLITYTKGDETTLEIKPEGSYDGTNFIQMGYKATQATGVSAVTADILQITGSLTVALPPMSVRGFQKVRLSVKGTTPGAGAGTLAVSATASIEAAGSRGL